MREGWRIVYAEEDAEEERRASDSLGDADSPEHGLWVPFSVDDQQIRLAGRIDRIDFHEVDRRIRILDYKTGDTAQTPNKTHRKDGSWIDLQLPLYKQLWSAVSLNVPRDCEVELAYFNLPRELGKVDVAAAEWDEATLQDAYKTAEEIVRKLRKEVFWPPVYDPVPAFSKDFAAICLDNLRAPVLKEHEEGDAA